MRSLLKFLATFIISFIIYLVIAGTFNIQEIIVGLILSLIIGLLFVKIIPFEIKYLNPVRLFWFIVYIPFFIWEMIKANFQIAAIVINPALPIKPGIVEGETSLKSPLGRLMLTSSITLTPGTLSVDIDDEEVSIHCVVVNESADEIIAKFEKYIKRITE